MNSNKNFHLVSTNGQTRFARSLEFRPVRLREPQKTEVYGTSMRELIPSQAKRSSSAEKIGRSVVQNHGLKPKGWFFLAVISAGGCWGSALAADNVEVVPQFDVEQGRKIYQARCQECHGEQGRGDGPRAALLAPRPGNLVSAATSSKTDEELLKIITRGIPRTAMHGWEKELSEDDRRNVLAFIRSLVSFQDPAQTPPPP